MTSASRPQYEELYVVSDLHLGGKHGFQIFCQGPRLAWLIDHLRERLPGQRVALLLNGDIVDFLAEDPPLCFDPAGAIPKLERIFQDEAFAPVFAALERFVKTERRTLILVLGNHDIELALPPVRERLLFELCQDDAAARGRIHLALDGQGYACDVGGAQVLCVHGNEIDQWNVVDHEALRRAAVSLTHGVAPEAVTANAGTNLVIEVMNPIKARFPFVDLLKPETEAVLNLLPWVDPKAVLPALQDVAPLLWKLIKGRLRLWGVLGEEARPSVRLTPPSPEAALLDLLGASAGPTHAETSVDALFAQTEADFQSGLSPLALAALAPTSNLGHPQLLLDRFLGRDPREALRKALADWLRGDQSFDYGAKEPSQTLEKLDPLVSTDVDFLIAGHTHLARALRRPRRGFYYNSGTWIRLIRLTPEVLTEEQRFAPIYDALTAGRMAALDDTRDVILRRATVVCLRQSARQVVGTLEQVEDDATTKYRLGLVDAKTRFVKE